MDRYDNSKKDTFEAMWDDQLEFNKLILPRSPEEMCLEERQYWIEKYLLLMQREGMEVLNETNFKPHRKMERGFTHSNVLEELTDVFKYFMCLCQVSGISSGEIVEEYNRKSNVVRQRYYQEKILKYDCKIVGVDIDGVLADYPRSFVEYINERTGSNIDYRSVEGYNVAAEMGLSKDDQIKYKHEYRDSGQKRFIPVIDGARQFLDELRYQGYTIVLLTSRPVNKYKRMFADTQYWLSANKLHYDAILFDEDKGERLVKEFGKDKVEFFVDDVAQFANGVSISGFKCYLLNKSYNRNHAILEFVQRVDTLEDILEDRRKINAENNS